MNSGLAVTSPVDELHACLDRLRSVEPGRLTSDEQARLLLELSRAESRLAGLKLELLAAAERSHTARRAGAASTGQWAAQLVHADGGEAQRQVGLATGLAGHAPTRRALGEGRISPGHAEVILRADRQLPATVSPEQRTTVERSLLTRAETMSPSSLRRVARRAISAIEPDTSAVDAHEDAILRDEEADARARARLTLHDNHDGTVSGHFTVPTLQGHLLRKILETMTAPRRGRLGASQAQSGPADGVHTDWDHARGTAFCELLEHLPTDHLHSRAAVKIGRARHRRNDRLRRGTAPRLHRRDHPGRARRPVRGARPRPTQATVLRVPAGRARPSVQGLRGRRLRATVRLVRASPSTTVEPARPHRPGRRSAAVPLPPSTHPRHRFRPCHAARRQHPVLAADVTCRLRKESPRPSPRGRGGTPSAGTARRTSRRAGRPGRGTPGARSGRRPPRSRP
jgi:hypothetical protein